MASTKIVLNRQSDLILNNASIVAPVGIVIADIAGLVSTVASIDSKGTGDMSAEASLRIAGDVSVTAAMSAEISTRVVAETSLQNNVDAEASLRIADVDAEESRAIAAEGSLAANLSTEASRAIIAEASLNTKVEFVISNVDGQAIDSLTEIVTAFQNADGDINGAITLLSGSASAANSAEASIRLAADESISANLSTELVDRAAAVSTEVVARISGDTSIALDLSAEVQARISDVDAEQVRAESAETVLTANLSSELVARASAITAERSISLAADTSIATGLSSELVDRAAAVSTEASLRVVADASIAANLSTELIARVSGDASVMLALSATFSALPMTDGSTIILDAATNTVQLKEAVAAPASGTRTFSGLINVAAQPATLAGFGDLSLVTKAYASAAVSTEASRAVVAETSIAAGLSSELVARAAAITAERSISLAADTSIAAGLSSELVNRASADTSIATNLSTEKARIDAILLASDADKDSFAEIVTLINSVDTTNDDAFAGYVLSNNAALSTEISNRISDVDAEESRATSAELSLDIDLGLHNMGIDAVDMWEVYQDGFINGWNEFTSTSFNEFFGPSNATNFALFMRRQQNILRDEAITQVQSNINNLEGNLSSNINNLEASIYSPSDLDFAKNYNYNVVFRDSSYGAEQTISFNYNSMFFNNGATPGESYQATKQAIQDIQSAWWTNEVEPAYNYVTSYDHGFTTFEYLEYVKKTEIYEKYGSVINTLGLDGRLILMESEIGTLTHFQKFEALINEIKDNLAEKAYELQSVVSLGRGLDNSPKNDGTFLSNPVDDANYLCNDQPKLNVLSGYGDQAITYPEVIFAVRTHGTQWYTNTVFPASWWDEQGTQVKLVDLQYFMNTYIPGGRDYSNTDISRMSDYEYAQYVNLYDEYVKCLISEAKMTALNNEIPGVINNSQFNFLGLAKFKAKMVELDNRNYFTSGIEQALWQGGFIKPADMLGLLLKRSNKKVQVTEVPDGVITEFTLVTPVRVSTESIYLNGLLLDSEDYTATVDGFGRVLAIDFFIAPSTGDKVRVSGDC